MVSEYDSTSHECSSHFLLCVSVSCPIIGDALDRLMNFSSAQHEYLKLFILHHRVGFTELKLILKEFLSFNSVFLLVE